MQVVNDTHDAVTSIPGKIRNYKDEVINSTAETLTEVLRIQFLYKLLVFWAIFAAKLAFWLLGLTISNFVST